MRNLNIGSFRAVEVIICKRDGRVFNKGDAEY